MMDWTLRKMLAAIGLFGTCYLGLTTIVLHLLPTGYDPIRQVVSDYAVGKYGLWMDLGFFAGGIGVMALASTLYLRKDTERPPKMGATLLFIAGISLFVVGIFPTDVEGAPATMHGTIHNIVSQVIFILAPIGMLLISRRADKTWLEATLSAFILAGSFFAANSILVLDATGLAERLFIAVLLGWWILASYHELNPSWVLKRHGRMTLQPTV